MDEITKNLKEECPKCNKSLYAYWHTPACDHPELGCWYVECPNPECTYLHDEVFPDEKNLFIFFTIKKNN